MDTWPVRKGPGFVRRQLIEWLRLGRFMSQQPAYIFERTHALHVEFSSDVPITKLTPDRHIPDSFGRIS